MAHISPNLDDRDFNTLFNDGLNIIKNRCHAWQSPSLSDPGMILLDVFAHLTEGMLYQLNRIPERMYLEFIKLIGVKWLPPAAASVKLEFRLTHASPDEIILPAKTQVTPETGESIAFLTDCELRIAVGGTKAEVTASHCTLVEEVVGVGTGDAGLTFHVSQPPIVMNTANDLDIAVGVEIDDSAITPSMNTRIFGEKTYELWERVDNILAFSIQEKYFMCDYNEGIIRFPYGKADEVDHSPNGYAGIVGKEKSICVWYPVGGGPDGNLAEKTLTRIKESPRPELTVINRTRATGGKKAESLESVLRRAPEAIHSSERAVTAQDYEYFACQESAIERAKAFTKVALWKYAPRGLVSVFLVPAINRDDHGVPPQKRVTMTQLVERQVDEDLMKVKQELDKRKNLGTSCEVRWAPLKPICIHALIVPQAGVPSDSIKKRVEDRLHQAINPLHNLDNPSGLKFGQSVYASDIYSIILKEPGIRNVAKVRIDVEHTPHQEVKSVCFDPFLEHSWLAIDDHTLYSSANDGKGWEPLKMVAGESLKKATICHHREGVYGFLTHIPGESPRSAIYYTLNNGDHWQRSELLFTVQDLVWGGNRNNPILFLAGDKGLYRILPCKNTIPQKIELFSDGTLAPPLYSVACVSDKRGRQYVVTSAQSRGGLYLSVNDGEFGSFKPIGFNGRDVRTLTMEKNGDRIFLWIGITVLGNETGSGCYRLELTKSGVVEIDQRHFNENWSGGSCRAIAFMGQKVIAATHRAGTLVLDLSEKEKVWHPSKIDCGLPVRDINRVFLPIDSLAVNNEHSMMMVGTPDGVYHSSDGITYNKCSDKTYYNKVTLPPEWIFCSGDHVITIQETVNGIRKD